MVSACIVPTEYPRRRYPIGKVPLLKKSLHHNCKLGDFEKMFEAIGEDVYNDIMNNHGVGVILKLASWKMIWAGKIVEDFISNQLATVTINEFWTLIGGRPVRFSLHEFAEITQLKCDPFDGKEEWDIDHTDFWREMKVKPGDAPSWKELLEVLDVCRTWSYEKKKRVGLLFLLHVGIYGFARSSRIPLMAAKRVLDLEAFERYPWGRVSFRELVKSINIACLEGGSLTVHGCVHAMLVWAYESVPVLGEKFGNKREAPIPLLRWASSRARYNLETVLLEEKKNHGKVRVTHLLMKPLEGIYPPWEGNNDDKEVDNMIRDIIGGCLDESWWDVESPVGKKKKRKVKKFVEESEDDFVEKAVERTSKKKGKKIQKTSQLEEKEEKEKKEKKMDGKREKKDKKRRKNSEPSSEEEDMSIPLREIIQQKRREHKESRSGEERVEKKKVEESGEVLSLLKSLIGKVDELGKKCEGVDTRLASIENKKGKATEVDAHSKVGDEGDGSKNADAISWIVEQQATSQAEFPINRVVRNRKVGAKVLPNVETAVEKKKSVVDFIDMTTEKSEAENYRKPTVEKKKNKAIVEFVDMTKDVTPTPKGKHPSSVPSNSDLQAEKVNKALGGALDKLLQLTKNDDFGVLKRRKLTLAKTQVDPFIGSSGTIRIMFGETPSLAIYDPFAEVEKRKLDRLLEYVKTDLENPFDNSLAGVEFYLGIMTPKHMWPADNPNYGWLSTAHMVAGMNMLRQRSLQKPSPFKSERIAFIDPLFSGLWSLEYARDFLGREKSWVFPPGYFSLYNGTLPHFAATNKKWVEDVDTLYIPHNIKNEHWVAVVVDLVKKKVKVYDSIYTLYNDDYIKESCRAYAKMIPMLLKQAAPLHTRKKMSEQAWNVYRIKTIPQNYQQGDCGVYTLKYIECLALGHCYDGLCDSNIPAIRLKLAAEMMDELPEDEIVQLSDPNRHGPLQTDYVK